MNAATVLEARGVSKHFPGVQALADVDIALGPGRVHALLGENGAGKSTLVKILTGTQQPDAGLLRVGDSQVTFHSPRDALSQGVTAVQQELTILPDMTVLDNVMLGHESTSRGVLRPEEQRQLAQRALERVAMGELDLSMVARDLSLANKQLLEIARTLVRRSRVLILDEPSAVLSGDKLEALHAVVRQLAGDGVAVLYITHLLEEVHELAHDITVLRDGRVVSTGDVEDYTTERIIRDMVGRTVEAVFPPPHQARGDVLLRVRGLVPSGSDATPVDLDVRRGEIVGIAGLVGAGRTRLLRTIAGVRGREAGTVEVAGRQLADSLRQAVRAGIVLVPEERKRDGLVLDMPVAANVTLTALRSISRAGWLRPDAEAQSFVKAQQSLGIRASGPSQTTRQLSGGNQQKVVLAKWLRVSPTVLLLDEPTRGVDVGAKSEIYDIVSELAESGLSIIIASSELPEVMGLSHRVLVCRGGSVVGEVPGGSHDIERAEEIMHLATGARR
jgi:ABC-type sugar transport system ATPase subunit